MTTYIAAYDTEQKQCLAAIRKLVKVHEKYEMPATFFIVAELLDRQGDDYRSLLGNHPLFEIAGHSYTHALMLDDTICGRAVPVAQYEREVVESKERIENLFGCKITGFRTPVGCSTGLRKSPELLKLCRQAGYRYTSTLLWGPKETVPALVRESFTYAGQGYPELLEIPACGWHENLLKGNNGLDPLRMVLFPHPMPEAAATDFIKTPGDEFQMHRRFIDKAIAQDTGHVSLIWHPWSLDRFDPGAQMPELLFKYVRELGLPVCTFANYAEKLQTHCPARQGA